MNTNVVLVTAIRLSDFSCNTSKDSLALEQFISLSQDEVAEKSVLGHWIFLGMVNISTDPLRRLWTVMYIDDGILLTFHVAQGLPEGQQATAQPKVKPL